MKTLCKVVDIMPDGRIKLSDKDNKVIILSRAEILNHLSNNTIDIVMPKVKCIQKQRDKHNNIIAYLLQDHKGEKRVVKPKQLKEAMYNFKIDCVNLSLTSDNKLIDKSIIEDKTSKQINIPSSNKVNTVKLVDKQPEKIKYYCIDRDIIQNINEFIESNCKEPDKNINVVIMGKMSDPKIINSSNSICIENTELKLIKNTEGREINIMIFSNNANTIIKLPRICRHLFYGFDCNKLVLNGLDWSDVESTEEAFKFGYVQSIKISNSQADKLKNMYQMFKHSDIKSVNFATFKVPNLDRVTSMFHDCVDLNSEYVDLSGLSFKNVRYVGMMIYKCKTDTESIIEQCKALGWKGYADGREDDFDTTFSTPIKYYSDEIKKEKHKKVHRHMLNLDTIQLIREAYGL